MMHTTGEHGGSDLMHTTGAWWVRPDAYDRGAWWVRPDAYAGEHGGSDLMHKTGEHGGSDLMHTTGEHGGSDLMHTTGEHGGSDLMHMTRISVFLLPSLPHHASPPPTPRPRSLTPPTPITTTEGIQDTWYKGKMEFFLYLCTLVDNTICAQAHSHEAISRQHKVIHTQ